MTYARTISCSNYVTVCPDGYRWEKSVDVTGVRRRSEWVTEDLLRSLGELEVGLKAKIDRVMNDATTESEDAVQVQDRSRAQEYVNVLTRDPCPRP